MTAMSKLEAKILKFEFESRIFISFGLVMFICALSFTIFARVPADSAILGSAAGIPASRSLFLGYLITALFMAAAAFLRIWSGSILTSRRMMSFKVKTDALCFSGPYVLVRNPIYLADLIAFSGFVLVLPPIGLLLPFLLFLHYTRLIRYEEISLLKEFGMRYFKYQETTPRLLPNRNSIRHLRRAFRDISISRDGLRHNALYLSFIPGFVVSAFTGRLLWAIVIGLPAVLDWAIVHTKIGTAKDAVAPKKTKKVFQDVLYANCWEDPALDREAFKIAPDDVVFSITSGGCNVLTFLLDDPRKVIALDVNPHQNFLLELKIAAFRELSHAELLEFFGVRKSSSRLRTYARLRPALSANAARHWDNRPRQIDRGLIHVGRYEGYMRLLRKSIVAIPGKRRLISRMFETEAPAEREKLFHERWEDLGWMLLTRIMLSRRLNCALFDKAFFAFLDDDFSFGRHFAAKAERALVRLPMKENYFLAYILLGRFYGERYLPHYLREENHALIRERLDRVEIVTDNCRHCFAALPDSSVSQFNFSNIFEWMSPEAFEDLLHETVRVACDKAILTYRNLLVRREHPASLEANIRSRPDLSEPLKAKDLSFIYNNYVVEEICKERAA
jgi:S-adenosylmethionine-diacylglycerol 3-amino-3-carboxypropyl transferase